MGLKIKINFVKSKIPRISDTEMIALRSGNTSLDRSILQGKIRYPKKPSWQTKFPQQELNKLLNKFDNSIVYPNKNNNYWVEYLAKNKYFPDLHELVVLNSIPASLFSSF